MLRPTWMEVYLGNVRANYRAIRKHIGAEGKNGPKVFVVVKANAYNLGAVQVSWSVKQEGADFFIVATADEAMQLRAGGITDPVLVLGASPYEAADAYVTNGIRASITDMKMAQKLSEAAVRRNTKAFVHFKVDTGMGRIGFRGDEAVTFFEKVAALPGIECEGIFTHFATSDTDDLTYTEEQHDIFMKVLAELASKGFKIKLRHCCNSGGTIYRPEWALDGVRPGQLLAGMYPSQEVPRNIPLLPGFAFKTRVSAVRHIPKGCTISYGQTYTTSSDETLAVLPVGYADGFARGLSNIGEVLVHGVRCPVVGRICMDQCIVNVSKVNGVEVDDEVVMIGKQGNDEITIYEYAGKLDTIVAAVGAMISARVPRVYVG